jgi:molybdate transport system regulatory protein
MPMTRRSRRPRPELELRVMVDGLVVIGPAQAMLLEAIRSTGSIAAAQRQIGASNAYVWKLVAAMNEVFSPPLVDPIRGGARGGGAMLTDQGLKVLDSFRWLEGLTQAKGHAELLVISRAAGHGAARQECGRRTVDICHGEAKTTFD